MTPPAHVLFRIEAGNTIPEEVWIQAGIAGLVMMGLIFILYSLFLKNRLFPWWFGGPRQLILRELDQNSWEAIFEGAGLGAGRSTSFEYVLEVGSAATHTKYSPKHTVTTTIGENRRFYRLLPTATPTTSFLVRVPIPPES
ncbi:MAG TPA: hypothetical protein PKO06_19830, partial [Candidatus Ozemobacteraceae bacterium]|nr:hypothetical protein [Candidatus Ozemobacteraceae bacterium]